jgi:uncharacterized protein (TIGR03382 family)
MDSKLLVGMFIAVVAACSSPGSQEGGAAPSVVGNTGLHTLADDGGTCPPTNPIDAASLPWEPPASPQVGACSESDLSAMIAKVKSGTVTSDDDFKAVLGGAASTCSKCIFTDASKAPWGPLPETTSASGPQVVAVNTGGCYAYALGNAVCGEALQHFDDCKFTACFDPACPTNPTPTELQNCYVAAEKGACKSEGAAINTACAGVSSTQLEAAAASCEPDTRPDGTKTDYTFEGPVRVFCIGGIGNPDGGPPPGSSGSSGTPGSSGSPGGSSGSSGSAGKPAGNSSGNAAPGASSGASSCNASGSPTGFLLPLAAAFAFVAARHRRRA